MKNVFKAFKYTTVLFFLIIINIVSLSKADPLTGDIELLKIVATGYKSNFEKINNMQGAAKVSSKFRPDENTLVEELVDTDFIADKNFDAYRWNWKPQGTSITDMRTNESRTSLNQMASGMLKANTVHRFRSKKPNSDGTRKQHVLEMRPEDSDGLDIGMMNESFNPYYFFEAVHPDFHHRLMWYYKEAKNPKLTGGKVYREGDLVIFEVGSEDDVLNRYTFDLSKGCNLVEYLGKDSIVRSFWEFDFQEVDGVYVPSKLVHDKTVKGESKTQEDRLEVTITNIQINTNIQPSEFSIEKLGIQPGDMIDDLKVGLAYMYRMESYQTAFGIDDISSDKMTIDSKNKKPTDMKASVVEKDVADIENITKDVSQSLTDREKNKAGSKKQWRFLLLGIISVAVVLVIIFKRKRKAA